VGEGKDVRQIDEILLKAGHAKSDVARLAGVSLCSVKRIAQESPVLHVDEVAKRARRQIGRPSRVANFRNQVVGMLQEEPDLVTLEILRRVRAGGYRGGKKALYSLVSSLALEVLAFHACQFGERRGGGESN
jgi:hypothetical protein